jgi:hypothetical protein
MTTVSDRTLVRLAWATWAVAIVLVAIGVGMLLVVHYRFSGVPAYGYWRESSIQPTAYAVLGLVIATRRPRHPIGWLLMGLGVVGSIQLVAGQYATLADAADLPGRRYGVWAASLAQASVVSLIMLLLLLFPTGRVPSPRWRPVAWSLVAALGLVLSTQALMPRALSDAPGEANPLGVPALEPILGPLGAVAGALLIFGVVGALASLVVRLRRARGRERQQLKWFVYVALLGILSISPLGLLLSSLLPSDHGGILDTLLNPWLLAPTALMVTVAAAIVRHQLYDIDRVINRTLVYGLLTVLLGAIYTAGVFGLGRLLNPVTGESALAVAAATLAVAALFQPARRRIQAVVDRRFNRRRYDAAKTIQAFSTRLRDQLDLDTLSTELLAIVDQTTEPTLVSLWLRPSAPGASGTTRREAGSTTWTY